MNIVQLHTIASWLAPTSGVAVSTKLLLGDGEHPLVSLLKTNHVTM